MASVTVTRTLSTPPEQVHEAMADVESFMRAAGFDEVELDLELVEREDATLAYEQREGIFREMWTGYWVEPADDGTRVTATTEFEIDVAFAGPLLDASVITRQRRADLRKQFDYLEGLSG